MAGYLGIDLGTSAVKVLVIDDSGDVVARATCPYPTHVAQPGWAEQSPADWWDATVACCRRIVNEVAIPVVSIGLSGQLNGFVALGEDNQPLGLAIIWLDIRALAEADELSRLRTPDIASIIGNPVSPITVLPKLVWSRTHRPEIMAATRRILLAKDYLLFRLTGEMATDPSDAASTAMARRDGSAWVPEILALADLDISMMPAIRPSAAEAGRLSAAAAAETGLPRGIPVATGAGDVAALALGCGTVRRGRAAITLGTAGHVVAEMGDGPQPDDRFGLWQIPHAVGGRMLWLGLIMSGGLSMSWLRRVLGAERSTPPAFSDLEAMAAGVPVGSEGLCFLPFLEGAATPYSRPDARGAFWGLSSAHGAGHMVRAVMEGVAFNARECIEAIAAMGVDISEIRLAEGGSQSDLWCQSLADVLHRPVARLKERDTSASGAAILGRAAAERSSPASLAEALIKIDRQFLPDEYSVNRLETGFETYRWLCKRLVTDRP